MTWLVYAIIAHVGNAFVFIIDKGVLGAKSVISSPAAYAATSAMVAALAVVVLPFAFAVPTTSVVGLSLAAGVLWTIALWLFFVGLHHGESARVVPIAGSSVPLFTIFFAALLGEQFSGGQLLGMLIIIGGGALLSLPIAGTKPTPRLAVAAAITSGIAFAAYFAIVDRLYDVFTPFLAAFAYSRLGVGVVGLLLWLSIRRGQKPSPKPQRRSQRLSSKSKNVFAAFVSSKLLGMGALLLQNYAISLGSVAVVNALQGTQYVALFILGTTLGKVWPQLYPTELSRVAQWQKIGGILLVAGGLLLVTR